MKKEEALSKLARQRAQIDGLQRIKRFSDDFTKWRRDTEVTIEKIFGEETRHLKDFQDIRYSPIISSTSTPDSAFQQRYVDGLSKARVVINSFEDEIQEYWEEGLDEPPPTSRAFIRHLCTRFHLVARQLRSRRAKRSTLEIEDEYDVQDLFHSLLTLHFDDIRPEEWTPSYAGSSSRVDFLLPQEKVVVEIKKTRKGLSAKEVGEQLIIDIQRYKSHPDCSVLVCFVYDPEGRIANPRGIENDLTQVTDGMEVEVLIYPRGV